MIDPTAGDALVGQREEELARLEEAFDLAAEGSAALVLDGEPGIGKTALWRAGISRAGARGFRVLAARPAEAERELSFAGLADLLSGVVDELDALAPPQRRALRVALLLEDSGSTEVDGLTVAVALLGLVRLLAAERPGLVAVDDTQWLDRPSQLALEYAARRFDSARVCVLAAHRVAEPRRLALDDAVHLHVGPVTLAATHELLRIRLGKTFARPTLVRVHETAGGNPFFALELARALDGPGPASNEPFPVPGTLRELVAGRLERLPTRTRETLLVIAALAHPTVPALQAALGDDGRVEGDLQPAIEAEVLDRDGDRLRFAHPLLASVRYAEASAAERQAVHRRLTEVVRDSEERARHLAASVDAPDETVAAALEAAALEARARGAPAAAGDLAEAAARLTPPESEGEARRRRLCAADYHFTAGSTEHARELLEASLAESAAGPEWARVAMQLASQLERGQDVTRARALLAEALREAEGDPRLQAEIHFAASRAHFNESAEESRRHAHFAVDFAERVEDPELLARSLAAASMSDFQRGEGIDHIAMVRAVGLEEQIPHLLLGQRPTTSYAWMLKWSGDIDRARPMYERLRLLGRRQGDTEVAEILFYSTFHELISENWEQAARFAEEAVTIMRQSARPVDEAMSLLATAAVAAHAGDVAAAEIAVATAAPLEVDPSFRALMIGWVAGRSELPAGRRAEAALELLRPATESQFVAGFDEPGLHLSIDLHIEAAVEVAAFDEARRLLDWIEPHAKRLDRAWALALAARGRALLAAAEGDETAASSAFALAYEQHARRPQQFPTFGLARTLLAHGTTLRRQRQKRAAHQRLELARENFERLDAKLWAERARSELARIGGRALATGNRLSETEQQIADLVCAGHSNKQVAAALSLSPKTVEWNLSKVYAKLGVRSRAELAAARR